MGIGPKYWDQKCIFAIKKHNNDVENYEASKAYVANFREVKKKMPKNSILYYITHTHHIYIYNII